MSCIVRFICLFLNSFPVLKAAETVYVSGGGGGWLCCPSGGKSYEGQAKEWTRHSNVEKAVRLRREVQSTT